jgi:hypothetical protein
MHATADAINAGFVNETEAAAIRSMWFSDPIQLASLSPFESYFVLSALHAMGDDDGMLYLVHRQWGGMLDTNATTVWERYDPAYADARCVCRRSMRARPPRMHISAPRTLTAVLPPPPHFSVGWTRRTTRLSTP